MWRRKIWLGCLVLAAAATPPQSAARVKGLPISCGYPPGKIICHRHLLCPDRGRKPADCSGNLALLNRLTLSSPCIVALQSIRALLIPFCSLV
jgi:hypothetical protein